MANIKELKNAEKNKDIYILGNGQSIKKEDLSVLKNKVSIGMNANCLLEKEFGFISQYYCVSDARFLKHSEKFKMATQELDKNTKRIFRSELIQYDDKDLINQTYYIDSLGKNGFSFDLKKGFYFGCTTTMLAIQLAVYLGAKRIFILGNDLKYIGENPRFYAESTAQEYDKFTGIQIWNIRNAYLELQKVGIEVYNCSQDSLLMPYLPYREFKKIKE
jgi:hypothetical protein